MYSIACGINISQLKSKLVRCMYTDYKSIFIRQHGIYSKLIHQRKTETDLLFILLQVTTFIFSEFNLRCKNDMRTQIK